MCLERRGIPCMLLRFVTAGTLSTNGENFKKIQTVRR